MKKENNTVKDEKKEPVTEENVKENKTKKEIYFEKLDTLKKEELITEFQRIYNEYEKMMKKEKDNFDYMDKYKRTLAEMENLRKRTIAEKEVSLKYANINIISDLLVILDDFERAIDSAKVDKNMDLKHFLKGIEMTEKQFGDLLFKKYGVIKYGEIGEEFDPQLHLGMIAEQGDYKTETVVEIFRNGYKLHDRVIRAAEVKVGKPNEDKK